MNLYTAIFYVGTVNIWRGIWMLYDIYLLPGNSTNVLHSPNLIALTLTLNLRPLHVIMIKLRTQDVELFIDPLGRSLTARHGLLFPLDPRPRRLFGRRRIRRPGRRSSLLLHSLFHSSKSTNIVESHQNRLSNSSIFNRLFIDFLDLKKLSEPRHFQRNTRHHRIRSGIFFFSMRFLYR